MATHVHSRSLVAFSSIAALLLSFSANPISAQTAANESTVIRGTVINSKTHEPIGHALVYSPDNRFAVMTDDRGRFQYNLSSTYNVRNIDFVSPYALLARKPGFLPPDSGQQFVQPGENASEVTISLVPESLIVGHIQIPGAAGSDRIQVGLYRRGIRDGAEHWDSLGVTASRSDGEFRFAELQPGSYKLVTHELLDRDPLNPRGTVFGFPPVYYPSSADFSTAAVIQLTPGTIFIANISPVRREYYPVKIKVMNPPADNLVVVQVWPQGHPGPGFALDYNEQKQTIEGSLPDGFYVVQVTPFGKNSMAGSVNLSVKGAPAEGQTISLFPSVSIPVSIRQEFQRQDSLNQLAAMGNASTPNGWVRIVGVVLLPVDDFGFGARFFVRHPQNPEDDFPPAIENVHPGQYRVVVSTPIGFASQVTSGGINLLNQPLVVSPGGAVSPIEIVLRDDGADVDGVVEGISPAPAVPRFQGQVYFIPSGEGERPNLTASLFPDGRFQMQQLPPGSYRVIAFSRPQELEYATEEAMRKYESKSVAIQVETGQKVHLRLQMATPED